MSDAAAAGLQRDAQRAAELEDAVRAVVEERLKTLNTSCPGIIKAFNRDKQTATVQPAHEQIWIEDDDSLTRVPLPLCTDVPVQFPSGGGCVLTFDVVEGDECILVFSQRCIDEWYELGGTRAPGEHRFHDLSDGMAIVGISSMPRVLSPGVAAGGAELRTRDGATLVRVEDGMVTLGNATGANFAVNGAALMTYLGVLAAEINVLAPGSVILPPAASPPLLCTMVKVK